MKIQINKDLWRASVAKPRVALRDPAPTMTWSQRTVVQSPQGRSVTRRSTHGLTHSKKNPQVPFTARRALLCFLVCLFLNILAVERESLFCFSPPHMLYSFLSSTRFLLTQLTIVCFSHRNASCVCPQTVPWSNCFVSSHQPRSGNDDQNIFPGMWCREMGIHLILEQSWPTGLKSAQKCFG